MKAALAALFATSLYHSLTSAIPLLTGGSTSPLSPRQTTSCANTATSRKCWGEYSIDNNWYDVTPDTGVTKEVCRQCILTSSYQMLT
jgi:hypothetical protein